MNELSATAQEITDAHDTQMKSFDENFHQMQSDISRLGKENDIIFFAFLVVFVFVLFRDFCLFLWLYFRFKRAKSLVIHPHGTDLIYCDLCFESYSPSTLISCGNGHVVCTDCLSQHIRDLCTHDSLGTLPSSGELCCVMRRDCSVTSLDMKRVLSLVDSETVDNYLKGVRQRIEEEVVRRNELRFSFSSSFSFQSCRIERQIHLRAGSTAVEGHCLHIRENIFHSRCPRCHQVNLTRFFSFILSSHLFTDFQ